MNRLPAIGDFELAVIEYGRFALDGGAMFGVVPKPVWERTNPPDSRNRIALAMRGLLIRGRGVVAITDAGAGEKMAPRLTDLYALKSCEGGIETALAGHGLKCEDITHVLITHLHFDHAGGATRVRDDRVVPTFPNARYIIQKDQLAWAQNPSPRDRASFFAEDFRPLMEADSIEEVQGTYEVAPGLRVFPCSGHTPGHQGVAISGRETVLFLGDLLPTASHLPVPFVMGYDLFPLRTCADKEEILGRAADEGHIIVFEHDPNIAAARIKRGQKAFELLEVIYE